MIRHSRFELGDQLACPAALDGDGPDHRHAQFARQRCHIDLDAAFACQVSHVQRQDHRQAKALDFQNKPQVELEVGRIADTDQHVRALLSGERAEDHVARNLLIDADGVETVGAG